MSDNIFFDDEIADGWTKSAVNNCACFSRGDFVIIRRAKSTETERLYDVYKRTVKVDEAFGEEIETISLKRVSDESGFASLSQAINGVEQLNA